MEAKKLWVVDNFNFVFLMAAEQLTSILQEVKLIFISNKCF